jgi:type 1 glutamine amidotransferase
MRKSKSNCLKWLLILAFITSPNIMLHSQDPAPSLTRVLIITGGHDFEREAFFEMFNEMPGIKYQELIHPEANQVYASDLIEEIDVLIFYDMIQEISDPEKKAFLNLLEKGLGMVFLHHSLASYQEWDEFADIIGGRYILSDQGGSTYRHGVDMPVHIVSGDHPLTKGINDFVIHDEVYGNFKVLPDVNALLTTTHPESGEIIAWTNTAGKSRIVYIQLGHDHHAYENPDFRLLMNQTIDWVK